MSKTSVGYTDVPYQLEMSEGSPVLEGHSQFVCKTMIAKNLLHQAILRGHALACSSPPAAWSHGLAAQAQQLARRLRPYTHVNP
jgi:hypothetical protein